MSNRKPFDAALFAENDARARLAVTRHLQSFGDVVAPNPNQYGVDLFCITPEGKQYQAECEVKLLWRGAAFPWETVQLPQRKAKYRRGGAVTYYFVLNSECTHAIVIPDELLDQYPPVEVPNKYVAGGEFFYQLPIEECGYVELAT